MLDFSFATPDEITEVLAARLKAARLAQGLSQHELARHAGVSTGTVKALENTGKSTLSSLIRIVQALGLVQELQQVFTPNVQSIADMEKAHLQVLGHAHPHAHPHAHQPAHPKARQRAPRRPTASVDDGKKVEP